MTNKQLAFRCANCKKTTKVVVEASSQGLRGKRIKKVSIIKYCEYCETPNSINIPETWDIDPLILGDQKEFLGRDRDGIPLIQGEKP